MLFLYTDTFEGTAMYNAIRYGVPEMLLFVESTYSHEILL